MLIVDASVALAWALPDEISLYAEAALARVEQDGLYVPDLWPHELANGLAIAQIRQRITTQQVNEFVSNLSRLSIKIEQSSPLATIRNGAAGAQQFNLTAYDAAYVSLASRTGLNIATLDGRMRVAAVNAGLKVFE